MGIQDKINATAKNLEGKGEEALGELTGDREMQAEGKAKQVQASVMHTTENAKDKAKDVLDSVKDSIDKA